MEEKYLISKDAQFSEMDFWVEFFFVRVLVRQNRQPHWLSSGSGSESHEIPMSPVRC